eukprot:6214560-Pleurochrysis_carterae.AAC.4
MDRVRERGEWKEALEEDEGTWPKRITHKTCADQETLARHSRRAAVRGRKSAHATGRCETTQSAEGRKADREMESSAQTDRHYTGQQ